MCLSERAAIEFASPSSSSVMATFLPFTAGGLEPELLGARESSEASFAFGPPKTFSSSLDLCALRATLLSDCCSSVGLSDARSVPLTTTGPTFLPRGGLHCLVPSSSAQPSLHLTSRLSLPAHAPPTSNARTGCKASVLAVLD